MTLVLILLNIHFIERYNFRVKYVPNKFSKEVSIPKTVHLSNLRASRDQVENLIPKYFSSSTLNRVRSLILLYSTSEFYFLPSTFSVTANAALDSIQST